MNWTRKRTIAVIGMIIVIILMGLGELYYLKYQKYEVVSPKVGEIDQAVYSLGTVKSKHRFEIKMGVVSSVKKLYILEGQTVLKGQPLVAFDEGTLFRAPFSGTVTLLNVDEGETATAQMIVLRLDDLENKLIELSLEQDGALLVKKGQLARVSFESIHGQTLEGKVVSVFPKDKEFLATIEVANLNANILPGMTADVAVQVGHISGTTIPLKAIHNGVVLVRRGGSVKKINVEVGLVDGLSAEIKNNVLLPDDEILISKD